MTEEMSSKPVEESIAAATAARQRRKRKWDQPAQPSLSASVCPTGTFPLGIAGVIGVQLPGTVPVPSAVIPNPVPAISASSSLLLQQSSLSMNAAALVEKLTMPKIQDELIAREIVINDAEPTVRYKLTKRLTQEEIQRCTGAVVITRGKYRPPNALHDSEKPLYLHISAGSHLKDTAERIKAVDHAASMVEEILKQGQNSLPSTTAFHSAISNGQASQPLSTCLFLGFQTDPSLNIAARIRGPNDQFINHIINETGATVVLRGRGSGNLENSSVEEAQQPLHLYISSTNPKSLEAARSLAENLLDTISTECGASRISSGKAYSAVPPPQQLLAGVQSSGDAPGVNAIGMSSSFPCTSVEGVPVPPCISANGSSIAPSVPILQPHTVNYSYPSVSGGTCYTGYGGVYPQATALQQVALALRKAPPSPGSPALAPTTSGMSMLPITSSSSTVETERQPPQKRKFQELPVALKESTTHHQRLLQGSGSMPPPNKLVQWRSDEMPPPPPRTMPPPPPPPKFTMPPPTSPPQKFAAPDSPPQIEKDGGPTLLEKSSNVPISDTLLKLVEYGEEEDDDTDPLGENSTGSDLSRKPSSLKPFWAV